MIKFSDTLETKRIESPKGGSGTMDKKEILDSGELFGKGKTLSELFIHPFCAMGFHMHQGDNEIYYILEGGGIYNDNGQKKNVKAGDVCVVKDGQGHSLENTGETDLRAIALILNS